MKILHVLNTAGVASVIAKFMDEIYGTESRVITRKAHDRYGLTTYGETRSEGFWMFYFKMVLEAGNYDIVHLHDRDILMPVLKKLYHSKPIVLHYHGTKIRGAWEKRQRYWKKADSILVSTIDLLEGAPTEAIHIPNPVDISIFNTKYDIAPEGEALYFKYDADDIANRLANEFGMSLTIHDRSTNPIAYRDMPKYIRRYKALVDVKRDVKGNILYPENTMSKTALEALACGLKVITYQGEMIEGLPARNHPHNVVKEVYRIYREVLN